MIYQRTAITPLTRCLTPGVQSTGTRVPVQTLLDYIEEGDTLDSFLGDFSTVTRDQAIQFLERAKDQLIECVSS